MDSGFRQQDVDVADELLIGAALLAPAFCEDLSTWRMTVARNGIVDQELRIAVHSELFDHVCIHLKSFVPPDALAEIEATARSIGFSRFKDDYSIACTDLQHTSITLNLDSTPKRVAAYGSEMLAEDGDVDMIGYTRLWEMLLEISPFRGMECHPASEDEARRRIRDVFGPIP